MHSVYTQETFKKEDKKEKGSLCPLLKFNVDQMNGSKLFILIIVENHGIFLKTLR